MKMMIITITLCYLRPLWHKLNDDGGLEPTNNKCRLAWGYLCTEYNTQWGLNQLEGCSFTCLGPLDGEARGEM